MTRDVTIVLSKLISASFPRIPAEESRYRRDSSSWKSWHDMHWQLTVWLHLLNCCHSTMLRCVRSPRRFPIQTVWIEISEHRRIGLLWITKCDLSLRCGYASALTSRHVLRVAKHCRYPKLATKRTLRSVESALHRVQLTKIDALNAFALIVNVRLVIDNEIPSITRLMNPYFPINLHRCIDQTKNVSRENNPYGSLFAVGSFVRCKGRSSWQVSISMFTSSNC